MGALASPTAAAVAPQREVVERVAALCRQAGTAAAGWAPVVAASCLVAVMWRFVPSTTLLGWLALTLLVNAVRIPMRRAYRRDPRRETRAGTWAGRYIGLATVYGACWGLAAILFLDAGKPLGVASFLVVAVLVPTGNVSTQSNYVSAVYATVAVTLGPAMLRLVSFGSATYLALAATLLLYALFVVAFSRLQSQFIGEGIRLRHRNLELIEALRAEKELADAERARAEQASLAKSQFLAAASHDLRQPLHSLGLFGASLREMTGEPERRVVVENILASIDALESLFSELLDLSRLDAGYIAFVPAHMPLAPLLRRVRAAFAPQAESKGLVLAVDDSGATVLSDSALLERLLANLLANAIRYTERGMVTVTVRPAGERLAIDVRDTGIGIAEAHRERIFDEFFQLGNPERDRTKGLGLGLAIVKRLSTMMACPVEVTSEVGRGSCFTVLVPCGDPARVVPPTAAPDIDEDLLRGRTVLVLDDEARVREGTGELLSRWGCRPHLAADATEALGLAGRAEPDLIVADLRLRDGVSGLDVIDAVRHASRRDVPAVVVTADTAATVLETVRARGYVVLHKPVRPAQLRAVLSQLLADRDASPALR